MGSRLHCNWQAAWGAQYTAGNSPTLTTLPAAMHFPVPAAHYLAGAKPLKRCMACEGVRQKASTFRNLHCVALLSAGCGAPQIALLTMLTVTLVPILQYQAPADYAVWPTRHPDHAPLPEACRALIA